MAFYGTLSVIFFPFMGLYYFFKHFTKIVCWVFSIAIGLLMLKYAVISLAFVIENITQLALGAVFIFVAIVVLNRVTKGTSPALAAPGPSYQAYQAYQEPVHEQHPEDVIRQRFDGWTRDDFINVGTTILNASNRKAAEDSANRHRFMAINPEWQTSFANYDATGHLERMWPFSYDAMVAVENWYRANPHLAHRTPNRTCLYRDAGTGQWVYTG